METISTPSTPQRAYGKAQQEHGLENKAPIASNKGFLDSSPISSKFYDRDDAPPTPIRTPMKDAANLPSSSLMATSPLVKQEPSPYQYTTSPNTASGHPLVLGSFTDNVTVGRCSAATYQVGRRNRLLSRIHLSIAWNEASNLFELTVLGLNGLKVDDQPCSQKEIVSLHDGSVIDIVGEVVRFQAPEHQAEKKHSDDFDIHTPLHSDLSLLESDSPQPESRNVLQHQGSKALSERLLAVVAESKHNETILSEESEVEQVKIEDEEPLKEEPEEECHKQENTNVNNEKSESLAEPVPEAKDLTQHEEIPHSVTEEDVSSKVEFEANEEIEVAESEPEQEITESKSHEVEPLSKDVNYAELIIEALVFSRKSSMPISDIYARIMATHPTYKAQSQPSWLDTISNVLKDNEFFGQITRKGKTADGTPKENLYYYRSDKDPVEWRQATYTQVGRSARKCTLQDKQYFWKIPPKLGRNRSSYVPPPAQSQDGKRSRNKQDDEDESSNKRLKKKKSEDDDVLTKENVQDK
ncbi:hypothetical protein INT43_007155 [Umbelopsis isabellina]|uniref:Uncharacterized protein n=1 Tax=Mortierella isabellina TaxID=91625 RepID=A0A8H7UJM5_MORIS|nr:hypothetical protein INT43_007155 [Umbelopsis isabellina]